MITARFTIIIQNAVMRVLGYQQLLKVTNFTQLLVTLEFWTLFTVRILLAFIGMNLHEFQT